jgi:CRISPR system Cascade subunit CasD
VGKRVGEKGANVSDLDVLLLRFDAPLMSFGGPVVDQQGVTDRFPGRSMITGLIGNALGWDHRDAPELAALQARLVVGARIDRKGSILVDYQTVDLGQPFLCEGWTTRDEPEGRGGGKANQGTHIRYRYYLADAIYTVAIALVGPPDARPTLDDIETALQMPERPLFLGRKPCIPSVPLVLARRRGPSLRAVLEAEPRIGAREDGAREDRDGGLLARFPDEDASDEISRRIAIVDDRDWTNQVHAGRRFVREGPVDPPSAQADIENDGEVRS